MQYGYETYRADSSVISSTERSGSVVFLGFLTLQPGQSGSQTYPGAAPGGLVYQQNSPSSHQISIDSDANGVPRLNWAARAYNSGTAPTSVAVMATKLAASSNTYGINVANAAGQVIVSSDYPPPQMVGYVDFNTTADTNRFVANGYAMYTHKTVVPVSAGQSSNRFLIIGIPDSGPDDTWYTTDVSMLASGQSYTVNLLVFTKASTYKLPRLFIFAIDNPTAGSSSYGIQVFSATQKLIYDASAENMTLMDAFNVNYPDFGSSVTYTPNMGASTNIGIASPATFWEGKSGTFSQTGYGAAKKVGGQLTFRLFLLQSTQMGTTDFTTHGDPTTGLFCPVVDLTYLGYGTSNSGGGGTSQSAPQITANPNNASVQTGSTAAFSVTATGTPSPTYQWYRGGVAISGATSNTYSFICSTSDSGATFYCIATNSLGGAQSSTATLTVYSQSTSIPVSFATDPASMSVQAGAGASFTVSVSGTSPITMQWYRNGVAISGATSNTYSFTASSSDNGATFQCRATNNGGANSATSQTATLTVTEPPPNAPVINQQPVDMTVNQGQAAGMSCGAFPADRYAWYLNDVYYADGQYLSVNTNTLGSFRFYCLVYNGASTTRSQTATLTVTGPSQAPYASYNDFSTSLNAIDNDVGFAIYASGRTTDSTWSNGTGNGTLYTVRATGNFTPVAGSSALNTTYDFAASSGYSWLAPRPTNTKPGVSVTYSLTVTVTLKGGGVVASSTITLTSSNSGTLAT